jgi:hypothetical protein
VTQNTIWFSQQYEIRALEVVGGGVPGGVECGNVVRTGICKWKRKVPKQRNALTCDFMQVKIVSFNAFPF